MQTPNNSAPQAEGAANAAVESGSIPAPVGGLVRRVLLAIGGVLLVLLGLVAALLYFNIESNPIVGRFVRDRIIAALQERVDPSLRIDIDSVDLKREAAETMVRVAGFNVRGRDGRVLVSAPEGTVTLSSGALATFRIVPTDIRLTGLKVEAEIDDAGALGVGTGPAPAGANAASTVPADEPAVERLRQIIGASFGGVAAVRDAVGGRLPQIGVSDASVTVRNRRSGQVFALHGIASTMESRPDGQARGRFEVKMRDAAFALNVELSPLGNGRQSFAARTENLQVSDLLATVGIKPGTIEAGQPIHATLTAEVDEAGRPRTASAGVTVGKLRLPGATGDQDVLLDDVAVSMTWMDGAASIAVPRASLTLGGETLALAGDVVPPTATDERWTIRLSGKDQKLPGAATGDAPVLLTAVRAHLALHARERRLDIVNAAVSGPNADADAKGMVWLDAANKTGIKLDVGARNTDVRAALRLWPAFAAPEVRGYVLETLRSGALANFMLAMDFPPEVMALAEAEKPLPDGALSIGWSFNRAVFAPMKGLPPIRDAAGTGLATGRTARVDVGAAVIEPSAGRRVALSAAQFFVPDTSRRHAEARLRLRFSASVDALTELMKSPALQPYMPRAIDPQNVKGQGEGELNVQMRLGSPAASDTRVAVNARLSNVTVEKALGNDRLENGNFVLSTERDVTTLKGEAKAFGTPAQVEMRIGAKGQTVASLTMVLDDATRARKGLALGPMLTGPVQVKLTAQPGEGDQREVVLEADLAKAAVAELVPGWTKKAGAPARAKGRLNEQPGGGWLIDRLELDAGTLSLRGSLNLGQDGAFQKAQLASFRLSPGDNVKIDADRAGGLTRIAITGNAFDVRPFLRSLQTGAIDKSGARDTEVTLKTTVLSGFGGELIANADLKLALRGTDLRRFDMTGRFDRGPVTAKLQPRGGSASALIVESEDAGAFLRFFDIYSRMRGGDLILDMQLGSGVQSGTIFVKDFALRDEPAMKRLVADAAQHAPSDSSRIAPEVARRLATSDVAFTTMTATFSRTAGRLDVKDAVMWGPEIGGSLSGTMDYARDRVELTGTFVPAYTLNNFFSQVPVLGPILGGGRNEGLFAVRYAITGRISAPTLNINPLTAIAPGFLRKIIDFRGAGGTGPSPTPRHEQ